MGSLLLPEQVAAALLLDYWSLPAVINSRL
jgi:hypothetical protein